MTGQSQNKPLGRPKTNKNDLSTREGILVVATRLYLDRGFQNVSIDDVAKEAGITKAAVYYYFNSKAELYKETMVALMRRVQERIKQMMKEDKPLYDKLLNITVAHLHATTSVDLEGHLRESKTSLSNEQIVEMMKAEEKMYESVEEGFKQAIYKGEIPAIQTEFASHVYVALNKVGNYKRPDGTPIFPSIQETAEHIIHAFWNGFFPKNN